MRCRSSLNRNTGFGITTKVKRKEGGRKANLEVWEDAAQHATTTLRDDVGNSNAKIVGDMMQWTIIG